MIHIHRFSGILNGLMVCCAAQLAWCQQPPAGKLYEQGVNAYFAGRCGEAEAALSEAIQWNSQDPRAYYFRALSLLRQGRIDEARGDLLTGATLEAQAPHRYGVGTALERVQGGNRRLLEKYRREARRDVVVQASATSVQPPIVAPSTFMAPEPDAAVIRQHRVVPLEELLRPEGPRAITPERAASASAASPQESTGKSPAPAKVAPAVPALPEGKTAAPPATAASNPFEDDSTKTPAETPAPKAVTPATPTQPVPPAKPEAAPPTEVEENPFGG